MVRDSEIGLPGLQNINVQRQESNAINNDSNRRRSFAKDEGSVQNFQEIKIGEFNDIKIE